MRVLVANLGGQLRGALRVVDGQHEELCRAGAGGVQQVEARCIPVKHLEAETSQGRDLVRVEVKDRRGDAVSAQQAADDVAEAAEAGDDDRCLAVVDLIGGAFVVTLGETGCTSFSLTIISSGVTAR